MPRANLFRSIATVVRRSLRVLARPMRHAPSSSGLVIHTYRSYGTPAEVVLLGRVLHQPSSASAGTKATVGGDLRAIVRRFLQWGVPQAQVTAHLAGAVQAVLTDHQGYFQIHLRPRHPLPSDQLWHTVDLSVVDPDGATASGQGQVLIPPPSARVVVISDIDDTVVLTGVANKLTMLWRLFAEGAQSRVAFPGVAAFYQALYRGQTGAEQNPLLYVSRGPWSIYEVLETFFQHHGIPVGPVLILRDWGLTPQHPIPRRAPDYKLAVIREMVTRYHALPIVLIGDSGQHDPEIYTQIVREQPGRVRAIYIRNVSRAPHRAQAIATLAAEVVAAGSTLLLAADTFAMAEHAAAHGLINPEALAAVLSERVIQQGAADLHPTQVMQAPTEAAQAASAVGPTETDTDAPPNVVIEAPTAIPRSTDADHP